MPEYFKKFSSVYIANESHVFWLIGPNDFVVPGVSDRDLLAQKLPTKFEVVAFYSLSKGITFAQDHMRARFFEMMEMPDEAPNEPMHYAPLAAVDLLLTFLRKAPKEAGAVVLESADNIFGTELPVTEQLLSAEELVLSAALDMSLSARGNPLLMMAPEFHSLRPKLISSSSQIYVIEIPLPDEDARFTFIEQRMAEPVDAGHIVFVDMTARQLAGLTAGLHRRHIENIILRARRNGGKLTRELALALIREQLDNEFGGIVKRIDKPFRMKDVGGNPEAKESVTNRIINPLREGKNRIPLTVLLVGPPGTGKTLLANAAANESGLNCLEADLSQLMGGIVGQTEQNVARFRRAVVANAPCMVFLDEIDQKARRGEGGADSGGGGAVENRLFAAILELTGDVTLKDKVVWIFASNRPDLLDTAFMSRMQMVIPMLPAADDAGRADVIGRIVRRMGGNIEASELMELAGRVKDWSGRDLEQVADEAMAMHENDGLTMLDALSEAVSYRRADVTDVSRQVKAAIDVCKDLRLLPERYRKVATEPEKPAENIIRSTRKATDWAGS